MIEIREKEACSGCTACAGVCPAGCIEMKADEEGFLYPEIDRERCVSCGKCERACPVMNPPAAGEGDAPAAYLGRTGDPDTLSECTSGGVFTALAAETLQAGGTAYGAAFDPSFRVRHTRIDRSGDLFRLSGSKYVQSDMGDTFRAVKEDLEAGKKVIFCGTPCQAAGLRNYLGAPYSGLLLADLVCHGVPSPKLWEKYTELTEKKHGKLKYANFRSKKLGYHIPVMEETFESGRTQTGSARTNLMLKCYFRNAADRPICYRCPFKTVSRCSDITLFDGWHASSYLDSLKDDDRGYTVILAHTAKGKEAVESAPRVTWSRIDAEQAVRLDGSMAVRSVLRPDMRDVFYRKLNEAGLEETVKELMPVSGADRLVERMKILLNRTGINQAVKKIRSR